MEVDLAIVDDIRRHTGKGNAQVTREVERIGKPHTELLEQFGKILTLDDTASLFVLFANGQTGTIKIGVLFLSVVKALTAHVFLVGDDVAPVLYTHHRIEGMGVITDGIKAADDATH